MGCLLARRRRFFAISLSNWSVLLLFSPPSHTSSISGNLVSFLEISGNFPVLPEFPENFQSSPQISGNFPDGSEISGNFRINIRKKEHWLTWILELEFWEISIWCHFGASFKSKKGIKNPELAGVVTTGAVRSELLRSRTPAGMPRGLRACGNRR